MREANYVGQGLLARALSGDVLESKICYRGLVRRTQDRCLPIFQEIETFVLMCILETLDFSKSYRIGRRSAAEGLMVVFSHDGLLA